MTDKIDKKRAGDGQMTILQTRIPKPKIITDVSGERKFEETVRK